MKRFGLGLLALMVVCGGAVADELTASGNGASITVKKASFASGETIAFSFTAPADLNPSAWFGLVPSGTAHGKSSVNDSHDVAYHYVSGKASGELSFAAPTDAGSYDIRLSDHAATNDRELVSLTIQVGGDPWEGGVMVEAGDVAMRLEKASFTSKEEIVVLFRVPETTHERAWAGIVPADVEHGKSSTNDANDLTYHYLNGAKEGRLKFVAPGEPGKYDVRLSDNAATNDRELASITFEVMAPSEKVEPSMTLTAESFQSHSTATIGFTVPLTCEKPWIALVPAEAAHGDAGDADRHDRNYSYLTAPRGESKIRVPGQPGAYEFRMYDRTGAEGKELAVAPFTVTAPEDLASIEPSLALPKLTFVSHEPLGASFKAPIVYDWTAWVGVVPSEIEHGTSAENDKHDRSFAFVHGRTGGGVALRAPGKPGKYDLRLQDKHGTGKEVAHISFEVVLPDGGDRTPKLAVEGTSFAAGSEIEVSFEAPAWFHYRAWVGLVPSEVEHGSTSTCDQHDVAYAYVNGLMQGKVKLRAPEKEGSYDVRLLNASALGGDAKEYASLTITVVKK